MLQEDAPATNQQRAAIVAGLREAGVEVEAICAAGDPVPTPFTLAHRFIRHDHRLTFRVVEPHWVLISMYERVGTAPTLRDPFHAMAWFVHWLGRQERGIDYVLGRVETAPFRKVGDLDDDRLLRYYLRWGGAQSIPLDEVPGMTGSARMAASLMGIRYVRVAVPGFRMPKDRARTMRRAGSRHGNVDR